MNITFTGPAFPFSFEVDGEQRWAHGVSLRDYAAIEMAKTLARYDTDFDSVSVAAYAMADALARASVPKENKDAPA
jgi:hypothetical protein